MILKCRDLVLHTLPNNWDKTEMAIPVRSVPSNQRIPIIQTNSHNSSQITVGRLFNAIISDSITTLDFYRQYFIIYNIYFKTNNTNILEIRSSFYKGY